MKLDIRMPLGLLFSILGILLIVFGEFKLKRSVCPLSWLSSESSGGGRCCCCLESVCSSWAAAPIAGSTFGTRRPQLQPSGKSATRSE